MRIGILETGRPPAGLAERFGRYDSMMADLIGGGFDTVTYRAAEGELPARPEECGGYLVTGSAAGVYDDLPWIAPLSEFLRQARGRAKLVGICFGHQLMAQCFGGRAEKSERGWGLGLHRYHVHDPQGWMDGGASFALPVSHQDQVTRAPPGARVLAGSPFAPLGMLLYDEHAMSMQPHPEFAPRYAQALLAARHAARLPPAELDRIAASLDEPGDADRVAGWIGRFLRG